MLVRWTARHCGRQRLIKEGHREITKVEHTRFNSVALLKMLQKPSRWLFGKPALTCAADDYRDRCHVLIPSVLAPGLANSLADSGRWYGRPSNLRIRIMPKSQSGRFPREFVLQKVLISSEDREVHA